MNESRPRVRELIEPVWRIEPALPLSAAARLLSEGEIDTLWVDATPPCELTATDIVAAVARGLPPDATAADATRHAFFAIGPDTFVEDAVSAMVQSGRHGLVVLDDHGPVLGVVRLSVALAVLLQGPPWLGALRIALHIDEVAW
jgi:predicted transcriptional regulator